MNKLAQSIRENGVVKNDPLYEKRVAQSYKMRKLIDDNEAVQLIRHQLPNEPEAIFQYRVKNFRNVAASELQMITTEIKIISNSDDLTINFTNDYKKENLGKLFGWVKQWAYNELINDILFEPNGGVLVGYSSFSDTEYPKTELSLYKASDVVYMDESEGVVLSRGDLFICLDTVNYTALKKRPDGKGFEVKVDFDHNLGYMPFFFFGGDKQSLIGEKYYSSFVSGAAPYLEEALVRNSEIQGLYHSFSMPTKNVAVGAETLPETGAKSRDYDHIKLASTFSQTAGTTASSPYVTMYTRIPSDGTAPVFPGVAYVAPTDEMFVQNREHYKDQIKRAYRSVSMEHLLETPLNQSGTAKAYDRSSLNNFLYKVATHITEKIVKPVIETFLRYRYAKDASANIEELMPEIYVPKRFDSDNELLTLQLLAAATSSGAAYVTIKNLQIELEKNRYNNDLREAQQAVDTIKLRPFGGFIVDDVIAMKALGVVSDLQLAIYANWDYVIQKAYAENKSFALLDDLQKMEIIGNLAAEFVSVNNDNGGSVTVPAGD